MAVDERTEIQQRLDRAFKQYVLEGIKLLEEKYGPEWVELGQEEWEQNFDIRSGSSCILGGIGSTVLRTRDEPNNYHAMARRLGLNPYSDSDTGDDETGAWRYGFSLPCEERLEELGVFEDEESDFDAWDVLQRLWTKELRRRGVAVANG